MTRPRPAAPFSPRTVLAMLVIGAAAFLLTLYFIGVGETGQGTNDGGGHAGGKGLNGYAALAHLLEKEGYGVTLNRNDGALDSPGLLILTPPHEAKGDELDEIVTARRYQGPTIVILPKWRAYPLPDGTKGAKQGWVQLGEAQSPGWEGFADDVNVRIGAADGWQAGPAEWGIAGSLPDRAQVQSGTGAGLVPLVRDPASGRVLAAFRADGGASPSLAEMAGLADSATAEDSRTYPVVFVFEPDLLDNYGLAKAANADLAVELIGAVTDWEIGPVAFDLTQNGLGRAMNLLTLAFTPPFLAATLCLIIAGIVVGWRAFRRFGPPLAQGPAIALGKGQLVANSAGLIRRSGRLHLLGPPYAALMRRTIAARLGLKPQGDDASTDAAIDHALGTRGLSDTPFAALAARLASARKPHELLRAADALKSIERKLG
ncbi:MAG: DUF4350 domain-containing protein [Novosphingobium sp.]